MKIWRYQNSRGHGPYTIPPLKEPKDIAWDLRDDMCEAHEDSPSHPSPWTDFYGEPPIECVFGFPSRHAAIVWFRGFHRELKRCGYVLICINVPASKVTWGLSKRQVYFPATYLP